MTAAALAAALIALSPGSLDEVSTDWEAGARTRFATQAHEDDFAATEEGQAELELDGRVALATPVFRLELAYEPVVSAYTPLRDSLRLFRHRGVANARWDLSPVSFAEATTDAFYGDVRLTRMPTATEPIERVPHAYVVRRTSFSQSAGSERRVANGTRQARIEYQYDRALTRPDSAGPLPPDDVSLRPQHTVLAALGASWNVRPLDALGARLEGDFVETEGAGRVIIARGLATLMHDLGLQRAAWAGLGASVTRDTAGSTSTGAIAELGAADPGLIRGRASGRLEGRLDTSVDRLSGDTTVTLEGRASLAVPLVARWRSEAALAGASFIRGAAEGTRIMSGEARVVWSASSRVELATSYYGFLQRSDIAPTRVHSHAVELSIAMRFHSFVSREPPPGSAPMTPPER